MWNWFKRGAPPDDPEEYRASLVEHLGELRDRLVRSLFALVIGWLIGWFVERPVYAYMHAMVLKAVTAHLPPGQEYKEVFHTVTEMFMLQLRLSLMIGVLLAFPYVLIQLWGFIAPGLKPSERKPFRRVLPIITLLFALGVLFCWFILPFALGWFAGYLVNFPGTSLYQEPGTIIFFCLKMLLAFGIAFQLPLVVWVLGALNVLSADTLIKYWRQSATGIFVLAAIVTPSNDAFSMLMMAIPLTLLFLISVYVVRVTQRKQKAERERQADEQKD